MLRTFLVITLAVAVGCAQGEEPAPAAPAPTTAQARVPTRPDASPLKEKVSRLNTRLRRAGPRPGTDLSPLLAERAEVLAALMEVDVDAALALALPPTVRERLARKHPGAARHLEERGTFEGESEVVVVDGPDLREVLTDIFLRVKGERLQVRFSGAAPAELKSGQRLRVRGLKLGARVAAEDAEVVPSVSALSATAACTSTGDQRTLVILATFPGQPQTLTVDQVRDVFFSSTQRSLTRFWSEASQGRTIASGDVAGWYTLDRAYSCDESDALRRAAIAAADADVDFRPYDRVFVVHPIAEGEGCYYAGLGTLSCFTQQTQDGDITASTSWLVSNYLGDAFLSVALITHEAGHNLGLHHSSSRDFGEEPLGPVGVTGTLSEYGDVFSTMGSWNLGHYAAPHKTRLGWLEPAAVATVDGTDGTFTLAPFSGPLGSGVQALRVRRGFHGDGWLWLEARRAVGEYDSTFSSTQVYGGALVHYEDPSTGSFTHLLDFTPETPSWTDPALVPGTPWVDPHTNVRLSVDASTPEGVTVSVHYEPVPCVRAPPTVEFDSFYAYAVPGWQVESGLTVTNNDSLGCAESTFGLQSALPQGWPTSNLPESITLAPGKRRFLYFFKDVPESTPYATYMLDATVTRDGESVQATDTLDVIEPCQTAPIEVQVEPRSQVVTVGTTAEFTVNLVSRDSRACGWLYFEPTSTLPEGWSTEYDPYGFDIEAGGTYSFTMYKSVPAEAQGPYTVDVQLLRDGYTVDATATATVVVDSCVRALPTFTALPAIVDVEPGGSVSYTLSLTSNDAPSCAPATFDLSASGPDFWALALSSPVLTVAPGATATATLTVTAPDPVSVGSRFFEVIVLRDGAYAHGAELEARVVCRRNAPGVSFTPALGTVEAGQPYAVTMTVTSTDNSACAADSFTMGAAVPAGWAYGVSQASLTLAPGASGSVALTVTPPETTGAGRYTVSAGASRPGADATTGTFAVDVTPPPLKATLSVPALSYKRNSVVPLTATVTRGTRSAQASVRFRVFRPDGLTDTLTVATDSTGQASWSYTARARGLHRVTATATAGTESTPSNTVSFSVQ